MAREITIDIGNGNKIVAEIYQSGSNLPKELVVYVRNKDGVIIQDLCLVRQNYTWKDNGEVEIDNDNVDCLVWADSDDEDYTHKHVIGVRNDEEEE